MADSTMDDPIRPTSPATDTPAADLSRTKLFAVLASLIAIASALSIPFLPVQQEAASISWPQDTAVSDIEAPLVSYAPLALDADIPCTAIAQLADTGGVLLSTIPAASPDAGRYGLLARVSPGDPPHLQVTVRDRILLSEPVDPQSGCTLEIRTNSTSTTVGLSDRAPIVYEGDLRPQVVGLFSDLDGNAPDGLHARVDLDSRFSSSPSVIKLVAMVASALATLLALVTLHRLDATDGRSTRRFLPQRWWTFSGLDAFVIGTLVLWHFIGATTSDDGYQFTMARASEHAGYMANYFRWFGVPETPFGTPYYDLLAIMAHVSTASPWMRLPALVAGIVAWLVISREVAPRLGAAVRSSRIPLWTGAFVFLAFWLPYNNGLRPEPIVAVGVLLTWCSVERAVATKRLLPAAAAILIGAVTVTVGPSGLICFGALIAGARPIIQIIAARVRSVGLLAAVGPLLAAGTVILAVIFADQTLAAAMEMQRVHAIGPNEKWFSEHMRYQWLFNISSDGSLARRFGVLVMILSILVSTLVLLRKGGRIPGTSAGPSRRIIGITLAAMLLMMFTPTKWTHHFGIYAGLAGSLAILTAVAVAPAVTRSRRNRALFGAAVMFVLALTFTGSNGWWYVSYYGVPWWDKPVSVAGFGAGTIFLGATVAMLLLAAWCFFREPFRNNDEPPSRWWAIPPLTVAAAAMVLFEVLSMAKGAVSQYPAFSLARSNVEALTGSACGLAGDILVEPDPNASMLRPLSGELADSLGAESNVGFDPNGVAADLRAAQQASSESMANVVTGEDEQSSSTAGTSGGQGAIGVTGSTVLLPFGLDPATTPVLGSYGFAETASLTSGWYQLDRNGDLVSIAVAGSVHSVNSDGIITPGPSLELEYGSRSTDGTVDVLGRALPIDIGPQPSWRNLRVPMSELPVEANAVRLVVADQGAGPDSWIAVTPPRVPQTQTLNDFVGSDAPAMIDWSVGLQFPCQRPFDHRFSVAEAPEFRILPDRRDALMTTAWQDHFGGGPLGWIDLLQSGRTIPTYLREDWGRDWGGLVQYSPHVSDAIPAVVHTETVRRSGMWNPAPIITAYP